MTSSTSIDLSPLERSIARLDEGLARHHGAPDDAQLRDGLIQRFEFTYELSHKTLKRFLVATDPNPGRYDELAFADLIRLGSERGVLDGDWPAWRRYREMRAKTSHAYAEPVALEVVTEIPAFLSEAQGLLRRLRERCG